VFLEGIGGQNGHHDPSTNVFKQYAFTSYSKQSSVPDNFKSKKIKETQNSITIKMFGKTTKKARRLITVGQKSKEGSKSTQYKVKWRASKTRPKITKYIRIARMTNYQNQLQEIIRF
jgi:hypothetical protein